MASRRKSPPKEEQFGFMPLPRSSRQGECVPERRAAASRPGLSPARPNASANRVDSRANRSAITPTWQPPDLTSGDDGRSSTRHARRQSPGSRRSPQDVRDSGPVVGSLGPHSAVNQFDAQAHGSGCRASVGNELRCDVCHGRIRGQYFFDRDGKHMCENCNEASKPVCNGCKRPISGQYLTVDDKTYHPTCFVCRECNTQIQGSYFMDGARARCQGCHEAQAPKCFVCNLAVLGKYVNVGDRSCHRECFVCLDCKQQISGAYFPGRGKTFMCKSCYERKHPPQYCSGCRERIDGRLVQVGEAEKYHPQCFCCKACRKPIDGSYLTDGSGYICSACQPRCSKCGDPLAGRQSVRVDGQRIHVECFRCCDCNAQIHQCNVEAGPGRYRCRDCHAAAWQQQEEIKEMRAVEDETRVKRKNSREYRLWWRPELVPCSTSTLRNLGVPDRLLPSKGKVCICYDRNTGAVSFASAPSQVSSQASINVSYLACVLRVLMDYRREPQFSLDPVDPHHIGGAMQAKKFYPEWLASTVVGEILFQADYALKELCIGDVELPGIPSAFQDWDVKETTAARQWFVMRRSGVTVSADGALIPYCQMGVEARRLVPSDSGYVDAAHTDPSEPMVKVATAITERFLEVVARIPVVGELIEIAKAVVICRFLLESGCRQNAAVMESFAMPKCPEGDKYVMDIPTLRRERRTAKVNEEDGKLVMQKSRRCMYGGVDLGIPAKKIPAKAVPQRLLQPHEKPALLPLFAHPVALAATAA